VQSLTDDALECRLCGRPEVAGQRRRPGITLELLHLEYLERHPDGYRHTRFCDLYRRWLARRRLSMRQVHRAGEKCFVDYAGQKPRFIDPVTGEVIEAELFVAALGASNYTYAEATRTQQVPDWVASHVRAFAFFGEVPAAVVCDQLKSGVVGPCRYEPRLPRTYEDWATQYGTAILPARPGKPLEAACARALLVGVRSYRHVDSILKHGLDRLPPLAAGEHRARVGLDGDHLDARLSRLEYRHADAVLPAVGGIEVIELAGDGGVDPRGHAVEPHQRSVPDQLCRVVGDAHRGLLRRRSGGSTHHDELKRRFMLSTAVGRRIVTTCRSTSASFLSGAGEAARSGGRP
jgi:transposase